MTLTRTMQLAVAQLSQGDAVLSGSDVWRQVFSTPAGHVIPGQTVKALAKRALCRAADNGRRITLTAAGRRQVLTLSPRNPR